MATKILGKFENNRRDPIDQRPSSDRRHGLICFPLIKGSYPRIIRATIIGLLVLSFCLSATPAMATKSEVHKGSTELNIFDSEDELAVSLSKFIADLSGKFVKERGFFTIVLTGDSLIKSMRKLLEPPYMKQVDWSKWYVFWADERAVPKNNPISNYKLDNDEFLSKVPIPADHIISINDKVKVDVAATDYENRLRELVHSNVIATSNTGFPKFDIILLGMGHNGHVASLFPNHPQQLNENKKWVTYITDSPKPPPERITMTFPVINDSTNAAFVVTGKDMANTVSQVFDGNQSSSELPAKMVSPVEGTLKWFLDKDATSMLKNLNI